MSVHVLMTTDAVGGVLQHTLTLAGALRASGAEVSVVGLGPEPAADQRAELEAVALRSLDWIGGRLEWMPDPWEDLARAGERLLELEGELRPDVIHAASYFCGALGFSAPVLLVAHSCVHSWWRAVHHSDPPAAWQPYRATVQAGLSGADTVVAPSAAMLADLLALYDTRPARALAIHNGAALDAPPGGKAPIVLAAGRVWDPAKNLEALAAVAGDLPVPVLVAGETGAPDGGAPADPGAGPGLHRLGRLPAAQLAHLRRRAAIFAAPARYEPFGLSILEAAGSGCALVLGDIPSLRELWDGVAAFVAPEDHAELRFRITELLDQPERAARAGRRARRRAAQLTPGPMAAAYARLYRELAGERLVSP